MDENKIVRVILQAVDDISGPIKNMRSNLKKDFEEIDKSFIKSRKGMNLYEEDFIDMSELVVKESKKITASYEQMSNAFKKAGLESKKARQGIIGVVQDIKGEVRGRRTIRGDDGKIIPGKGRNPGDRVFVDAAKKVKLINRDLNDALEIGYRIAKNTQKDLDRVLGATKEIRNENRRRLDDEHKANKLQLSLDQDDERANRLDVVLKGQAPIREAQLETVRLISEAREKEDLVEEQRMVHLHAIQEQQIKDVAVRESAIITKKYKVLRANEDQNYEIQKRNINKLSAEDTKLAIKKFQEQRKLLLSSGTKRDQIVKRVGFATGDFFGGIGRGRSQVRDLDKDLEKLASTFGRLGFAIGSAFASMSSFVNLRWLFITSTIVLFINLLTQLIVVLVSVASSAALAASALGAAFAGAVAQAVPVVGLLVGAFNELSKAMDAVKLADKRDLTGANAEIEIAEKKTQALQRLADAQYTVKKAIESVSDAEYSLRQSNKDVAKAYADQKSAIQDLAQARKDAAQDIIDANNQERDSALALEEAELAVLQAKEKLRQEEEKKRRGGADIAGAQAAVKEAQDRLNLAKSQGDSSEIIKANQQLSIASQNLNDIRDQAAETQNDLKDAQLGVKRAELNRQQAVRRQKKDAQEAQSLRKKGVNQSDQVINAERQLAAATEGIADAQRNVVQSQRSLVDSIRSLAVSRREENDAKRALLDTTNFQSTAQKNLNEAIADFSPSQKKLFQGLVKVKEAYKKAFVGGKGKNGILSPILDSFTSIADAITQLLADPKILKAFSTLAKGIGAGIKDIAGVLTSKSFKDDILFFISEASDNLPKVFNIFKNILQIVRDIARAGAPIFKTLLGGLDSIVGKAKNFTSAQGKPSIRPDEGGGTADLGERSPLVKFLANAEKHLDSWLKLGKAIGNVIAALVGVSAPTGKSLIESATDALNGLAKYIKDNPEEVKKFFEDIAKSFKQLSNALLDLAKVFGKAAKDPEIQTFAIFLVETIIPGILLAIKVTGLFFKLLNSITDIPVIGDLIKFAIQLAIMERTLNKLFPFTQGFTNFLKKGFVNSLRIAGRAILHPRFAIQALREEFATLSKKMKDFATSVGESVAKRMSAIGTAASNMKTKIRDAAVSSATAFSNLSQKIFESVKQSRAVTAIQGAFTALAAGITKVRKAMFLAFFSPPFIVLIIAGIIAAIVLLDRKFQFIRPTIEFFGRQFRRVFEWIKDNWKKLAAFIAAPFLLVAAPFVAIFKFRDKIFSVLGSIKDKFVTVFSAIKNIVSDIVDNIGKIVGKIWDKIPGPIKKIIEFVSDPVGAVKSLGKRTAKVLGKVLGFSGGSSGVPGTGSGDTVPAMLTPGEWVLNSKQIRRVASAMGTSIQQAKAQIFGTNMGKSGNPGVWGTAGKAGLKPSKKHSPLLGKSFSLIPQEDDSGDTVWFIELADGTFGQVTDRDAGKIQKSNGRYIPGYVKRNSHGFNQNTIGSVLQATRRPFAMGGAVPNITRGFAEGGVVQSPGFGNTTNNGTTVNNNFSVKTEGATDWAYVMRLSSITAQSAF